MPITISSIGSLLCQLYLKLKIIPKNPVNNMQIINLETDLLKCAIGTITGKIVYTHHSHNTPYKTKSIRYSLLVSVDLSFNRSLFFATYDLLCIFPVTFYYTAFLFLTKHLSSLCFCQKCKF